MRMTSNKGNIRTWYRNLDTRETDANGAFYGKQGQHITGDMHIKQDGKKATLKYQVHKR